VHRLPLLLPITRARVLEHADIAGACDGCQQLVVRLVGERCHTQQGLRTLLRLLAHSASAAGHS
jgi:hypothetical protein